MFSIEYRYFYQAGVDKSVRKQLEENLVENIIVAYICCKIFNVPLKIFRNEIKNFKGLPYRSQVTYKNKNLILNYLKENLSLFGMIFLHLSQTYRCKVYL